MICEYIAEKHGYGYVSLATGADRAVAVGDHLLILRNATLSLVECKAGMTYDSTDVKAFSRLDKSDYAVGPSCLICLTEKAYPLRPGVYALPISSI